ncbi:MULTISPECIES: sigma-70 family RNA polymerase sigma factor [unclassified Rhodococcus (in: high G+C Gram-positive bacteria)]|uniref:sigma-70 family RNA polymerase sigma factor n=1 Tax=unclassified Rhodococcus (in: high G+C Gram-positive bacteria) TaxID=192944 RepID=UPI00092C33BE|nr:sigma-70 family RNA polymerase sigma factor [Rhodococcus sp. M8]OLL19450.1 RNA polymerase subunit sigma [Rhodococcus sp. M8]QPG43283.1 sigma-70 family RNA polymerase sigma factor [Rhodococcus sp. M8]
MHRIETEELLRHWVPRAVAGEPHAVGVVVSSVRPHVLSFCAARMDEGTRAHTPAEDVTQEVCLALTRALPRYQDRGASLLRFAFGIATHKVADARRKAARTVTPLHDVAGPGPEEGVLDEELRSAVRRQLALLPEQQRRVVQLRILQGYSAERTAAMLGTSVGAVRIAQHRALQRIRLQLSRAERADTVRSAAR